MNETTALRLELDRLGALAVVYVFVRKTMDSFLVGRVVRSLHPDRIARLETVLDHLLTVGKKRDTQCQQRCR